MAVPGPIWFTDSYGDVMRHVVTYTTFDSTSTDVLGLNFTPTRITVDGRPLAQRSVLDGPGWTFDRNSGTLRIYHIGGYHIHINRR